MDSLYPFQGHYLDLNGQQYHYLDEGQGEVLLMVHGNPTWSIYYREVVKALRADYRCIVPDHIGCGRSSKPDDAAYDYTLRQRVDDLEALLDHLGIRDNITLIVHDWGGMIGMGFAARYPERIKRLVIFNTAAFHLPPEKPLPWMLGLVRNTPLGAWAVSRLNAFAVGAAWVGCTQNRMSAAVREAYVAPYNTPANRIATLRFVQDIPLTPDDRAYALVSESQATLAAGTFADTPALICWGMKDFVFDHHFLTRWRAFLPDAEVHEFPRAGHYVLEDASAEIIPLVQAFLTANPIHNASHNQTDN